MYFVGLADPKITNNIFMLLLPQFQKSQTIELYSVLDILLELNLEKLTYFIYDFKKR
jgi:hypothetical protein